MIERDARGLPIKTTTPPKHETLVEYDGDNNVIKKTDPEGNITKYVYDADNELTETEEPTKAKKKTEFDGAGQVIKQTNGGEHATEYKRNVLEQIEEVTEPGGRKTSKEYDGAGNLTAVTDAEKRTTKYNYSPDGRISEVTYSDGKTPTVKYEYNGDGRRTKMVDGTGTTTYEYDELDRLAATEDGHGNKVKYAYNLDNQPTKITYPNGESITREYDHAERLTEVTDWKGNTTHFKYNANSDLTATVYPATTGDEDQYAFNETDAMTEVKMLKGTETLASIAYTRSKDELVTKETDKGLPGEEAPAYTYDANTRLTKGRGIAYKYDADTDPTTIGTETLAYKENDEPEKRVNSKKETTATYTYNEFGQRTKTTPKTGPATTYEYNQAGNMTTVTRPKEGATPAINDTYTSNGDGLRTTQTSESTTTYLAWELAESLPLLLNDGTNSYIYGPSGLPIEQINNSGSTILYLHHDQQGSTRLITSSTGVVAGTTTYDAYGNTLATTGTATTPLGYDAQYTNTDTGLIYLRAREYDPATGQFMSVDPKVAETAAPYSYSADDPMSGSDPSGMAVAGQVSPRSFQDREQYLFSYLKVALHLSVAQTAGIIGNLLVESAGTLSPSEHQEEGAAKGIAQWEPPRWAELESYAAGKHMDAESLELQAKFIVHEILANKAWLVGLRAAKGPRQAAAVFEQDFEGAGSPHLGRRESDAEGVYGEFG
jgi:RHS repeat-associated protein